MFGLKEARYVQEKIKQLGVQDIELYFDNTILPDGMWSICQVNKPSGNILLLRDTTIQTEPQILWWCKTQDGHSRVPNDQDVSDIIITVKRAHNLWDKGGDWMADEFEKQDAERDRKHQEKFKERIHEVAPKLKKAIRKELG